MKIAIATPLYPPDIAEPAPYVKELARRLREEKHEVTVVLFGRLPEEVPGVRFVSIDKRTALPTRLFHYFKALWKATKDVDVLYAMNGPSVELTAGILTVLRRMPMCIHLGDRDSNEWVAKWPHLRLIKWFALRRAAKHVRELPPQRPEVLPFDPHPFSDFAAYEQGWKRHIAHLETLFAAVTKRI